MVWRDVEEPDKSERRSPGFQWVELSAIFDTYRILGVSRSASFTAIREAFRKLAREHHPDIQHGERVEIAKTRMQQINAAYAILRCVEKRAAYDKSISPHSPSHRL